MPSLLFLLHPINEHVLEGFDPNHRARLNPFLRVRVEIRRVVDLRAFVRDAFLNNSTVEFAVMDGLITGAGSSGSQGLRATFRIASFSRNEALEEAITVSVTAKPTYSANPPSWMTVA